MENIGLGGQVHERDNNKSNDFSFTLYMLTALLATVSGLHLHENFSYLGYLVGQCREMIHTAYR